MKINSFDQLLFYMRDSNFFGSRMLITALYHVNTKVNGSSVTRLGPIVQLGMPVGSKWEPSNSETNTLSYCTYFKS